MSSLVEFIQLTRIARRKSRAGVRRWLKGQGILYSEGADGSPYTTIDAINKALGVTEATLQPDRSACLPRRQASRKNTAATTSSGRTAGSH